MTNKTKQMKPAAKPAAKPAPTNVTPAKLHARLAPERVWLVLARQAYDQPLRQVGTVEADDGEMAGVYARSIYDEFAWVEMAVIPRDALRTVIAS
ncbi:MAG TPA: hypothetical protein VMV29_12400 [Ktedonobacterales bacterium]|nr:hypothetical protein [Ktedonobacterales bacterium]